MIEDTQFDLYLDFSADTRGAIHELLDLQHRPKAFSFCGLALERHQAKRLILELRNRGVRGYPVPTAYRTPRVGVDDALTIAATIVRDRQTLLPDGRWGATEHSAEPMWWKFWSTSEKLADEGWIPGAAIVVVDRCSARLWSADDMARYFLQWEARSELRLAELDLLSDDPEKQLSGLREMTQIDDTSEVVRSLHRIRRLRPKLAEQIDAALAQLGD